MRTAGSILLATGSLLSLLCQAPAGDILRGGAPAGVRPTPDAAAAATAQQAARIRSNAKDALARTTQALQAFERMQAAARHAAAGATNAGVHPHRPGLRLPDVPDGLGPGGLQPLPGAMPGSPLWTGADLPVQSGAGGRTNVTVRQTDRQALLHWETFNVGRNTSLHFDQSAGGASAGQWIAFNRVHDPSGNPSQILGSITAPGQVYLINRNGIVFGGESQVNVHTLVASSLPLNDNLVTRGLLNQAAAAQFLLSALPQAGEVPFVPPDPPETTGRFGDVIVLPGAQLTAPTGSAGTGGRIVLAGANTVNKGTISTPDGQTILAAGLQVGFAAHDTADPSLRGLDVFIGETGTYGGTAENLGIVRAPRGSVTIAGRNVRQFGAIDSSTSVALNGRVDLLANFDAIANPAYDPVTRPDVPPFLYGGGTSATSTGSVTTGPDSVLRILPEWGNPDKVPGLELSLKSAVNMQGRTVHMQRGSSVLAPNGTVTVRTGTWDYSPGTTGRPVTAFVRSGGGIYLDDGSSIVVAGTPDAYSPLERHILTVTLRSAELADSPLLRNSFFRGGEITVDLRRTGVYNGREWVGTPLADLRGYPALIERTVDELTVAGGNVHLLSGGDVVVRAGALIDTSAGWFRYGGGMVKTTRLMESGRLVDIADATPDRVYDGIYTGEFVQRHPRWGIEHTYRVPWMADGHFQQEYLHGASAGALSMAGSSMALDGTLRANAVSGPRQTRNPARGGSLDLSFEVQRLVSGISATPDPLFSPSPPAVVFGDHRPQATPAPFETDEDGEPLPLRPERQATVVLSPSLFTEGGFSSLRVRNPDGTITIPKGVVLEPQGGGSIALEAANIFVFGGVRSPGASLEFAAYNISPSEAAELLLTTGAILPPPDPGRGKFVLGPGARLDTSGLVMDHRPSGRTPYEAPVYTTGGDISIRAYSADLAAGSVVDVSGGVLAGARGGMTYGDAGSIAILAGRDLSLPAVDGGTLRLDGSLRGYSGATSGSLSLQAQLIRIGGGRSHPSALHLDSSFFGLGGFSRFSLTGIGPPGPERDPELAAVVVAPGTRIDPAPLGWLAVPFGGPDGELTLVPYLRPEGMRSPFHLALQATGTTDEFRNEVLGRGDILFGRGASIDTGAFGSVAMKGDTVTVLGNIRAPGGSIEIAGADRFPSNDADPAFPLPTVYLGNRAQLSTAGKALVFEGVRGWRQGSILPGGSIAISGNIVAERGTTLDVSGATGVLDLSPAWLAVDRGPANSLRGAQRVPVRIDTDGGSISLEGGELLYSDATLIGRAGGPSAFGGSLTVSSGRFYRASEVRTSADIGLIVRQSGTALTGDPATRGVGRRLIDAAGNPLPGIGQFAVSTWASGGFDSLALDGNIRFEGPVAIRAPGSLRVGTGGVIEAADRVVLEAPRVALGQVFRPPFLATQENVIFTRTDPATGTVPHYPTPLWGPGSLTVRAKWIDVGNLSLQGIGRAELLAPNGGIRGNGTLNIAGDLVLQGGVIHPTTGSAFNLFAYDYNPGDGLRPGSIATLTGRPQPLPLSAAGTLSLYASRIDHAGALRAPMGIVNLGWDGTGTAPVNPIAGTAIAPPVTGDLVLRPGSVVSVSAIDPLTGRGVRIPYGHSPDGIVWIDPAGNDITATGFPEKAVNLSAGRLVTEAGSLIDIRGGGELFAYRWVAGNGGTRDILDSASSFAILPGGQYDLAPFAPFNPSAPLLDGQTGYANDSLRPGDRVALGRTTSLPAGTYTLLPARYALLPGAFLVTPLDGDPVGSFALPDGSSIVSGYGTRMTGGAGRGVTRMQRFELAPADVVMSRADYRLYDATPFLTEAARARDLPVPALPVDSGYLLLGARTSMALHGDVISRPIGGGRGSIVDIAAPGTIAIVADGATIEPGRLVLEAGRLNSFGAESLLIGGRRTAEADGDRLTVSASGIALDNAGAVLTGSDIILAARESLTLAEGAAIVGTGTGRSQDRPLLLGDETAPGSGDGVLLRVGGEGSIVRQGVSASAVPVLTMAAGATAGGESVTLDSTSRASLDPAAVLAARSVNLRSGRIDIVFDGAAARPDDGGLALAGDTLTGLQSVARNLSLLSYTTIDLYGSGILGSHGGFGSLSLSAGALRGFGGDSGSVTLVADSVELHNAANAPAPAAAAPGTGTLAIAAEEIAAGSGYIALTGFRSARFDAVRRMVLSGEGSLSAGGSLTVRSPLVTAMQAADHRIAAAGELRIVRPDESAAVALPGGLGAAVTLSGSTVFLDSDILLPSGELTAIARTGDLRIGESGRAVIDTSGVAKGLLDVVRHTDGGRVNLIAETGSVVLGPDGFIGVAAPEGGGNAGSFHVSAPAGTLNLRGTVAGTGGNGGRSGSVAVDVLGLAGGTLASLDPAFDRGGFHESRDYRIRSGDVRIDGLAAAGAYRVSADDGSIRVGGTIDASGTTGGTIELLAAGSILLEPGSRLDASGQHFDNAGRGGAILLGAGSQRLGAIDPDALLDVGPGSAIDLGVASADPDSALRGQFAGTLHLRAPQSPDGSDLRIAPLAGTISGASAILAEGYRLYDLTESDGILTPAIRSAIRADGDAFLGAAGEASPAYDAIVARLLGADPQRLTDSLVVLPGAEILHRSGDLVLGSESSGPDSDWNLETWRFGPKSAPGVLTLRAAGDLVFHNTLSDGFAAVTPSADNGNSALWLASLMAANPLLPANASSWSYRLTAGADTAAAGFRAVVSPGETPAGAGSIRIGKNATAAAATGGANAVTSQLIAQAWQTIRTGSGSIDLSAARNIRLLNPLASVYTAGTQVADPTRVFADGDFVVPVLTGRIHPNQGASLGAVQQTYPAQYSMAGGNVTLQAGENIERLTRTALGELVPDSSRQLPSHWLYRRGYIDPATGASGTVQVGTGFGGLTDASASTTWWVDFSNFFQSVGALGGGNVRLAAGGNIANVDAVAPTNARMPSGIPSASRLLELGGGDVVVNARGDIDAGVYYVERGTGTLTAGGSIVTNSTRSPSRNYLSSTVAPEVFPEATWLPTQLFAGKSSFDVSARGDILLGPPANPFWLPPGINNKFWYKSYFSTYSPDAAVRVASLGGDVSLRNEIILPDRRGTLPILQAWLEKTALLPTGNTGAALSQPWLRLAETGVAPFAALLSVAPPTVEVTAFTGDIHAVGSLSLAPAPAGGLDLLAAGSIAALQPVGTTNALVIGSEATAWKSGRLVVSDADPAAIPSAVAPFAFYSLAGSNVSAANTTPTSPFLSAITDLFAETGSTGGVVQRKQALHSPGLLHRNDPSPVRIYALGGDLSGLTLFTPKPARIQAARDILDIAFYLQNLSETDLSVVAAGRDIVPYQAASPRRVASLSAGNAPADGEGPLAGDIRISGPGTLQIIAGRNLDLGTGSPNADGTGTGIDSIGNARNPYLPRDGAHIIAAAGLGPRISPDGATLEFESFLRESPAGDAAGSSDLPDHERHRLAIEAFFLALRDAGRNYNDPASPGYGSYASGFAAIDALFGGGSGTGDILTRGRSIRTAAGGNIDLLVPGGGLTMANTAIGNPLVPPGIITESGGNISIFADGSIDIGIGRIFTLRGGNIVAWSSTGDIAAGAASRTVQSAPPVRVIIDPQSGDLATDLAGLATGGGIGVLATVKDVPPGDVDLIAPGGVIDAGDAGIRVSGNINLAASAVLNASNISVGGTSTGAPAAPAVSSPNTAGMTAAATSAGAAAGNTRDLAGSRNQPDAADQAADDLPSIILVEVLGYGGGPAPNEEEEEENRSGEAPAEPSDSAEE